VKFHSRFFQSIFAGSIDQTREREREKSESAKGLMREREREVGCVVKKCKCDRYVLLDSNGMNVVLTVGEEVFFFCNESRSYTVILPLFQHISKN
jgi:hypothetical protein